MKTIWNSSIDQIDHQSTKSVKQAYEKELLAQDLAASATATRCTNSRIAGLLASVPTFAMCNKALLILFVFLLTTGSVFAQFPSRFVEPITEIDLTPDPGGRECSVSKANISGPTSVFIDHQETYNVTPYTGSLCSIYRWEVTGGQIISKSKATVRIKWTRNGVQSIKYYGGLVSRPSATKIVTVGGTCPSMPPSPIVSGNCGAKTLTRARPPSGVTYYWQGTSRNGTSTSNSSSTYMTTSTTGTYTYYLRARNNTNKCWSSAVGKTVTINKAPLPPSNPTISNNTCGSKTLTRSNPVSGVTWYWQGKNSAGTSVSNSAKEYMASTSGAYSLRAKNTTSGCWSLSSATVFVSVNSTPSQPATPSVSSNTCGSKTLTRSEPPSAVTWYWQGTNSSGKSTSNSSTTYSATSSGRYYIRAKNTSTGCWSTPASVYVTVKPVPAVPSRPTVSSNTCGAKTLTRSTPPSGVTWYWQGTSSTINSTKNSATTYQTTSAAGTYTYYLRARNNTSGCWSSSASVRVTINGAPSNPATPSVSSNTCGSKTLTRPTPPSGVTWYWQGTNSSGKSTSNSSTTYSATSSGRYYIRAKNNSTGCWSNALTSVYVTVNPVPSRPAVPTVSGNTCGAKTLTRSTPPSGVTWYWQGKSSGGTSTSSSSPTYTASSSGTYYLRARNNTTGCWSSSASVRVTINGAPSNPATPSVSSNTCGSKTLTRPTPPSGVTWYWQGTNSSGKSTSNSSTTYSTTSSGRYYIRARNNSTGCWSSASTSVYVTIKPAPAVPSRPTVSSNLCGAKTLTRTSPPSGVTWYWQGKSSEGTSTSSSSTTYTASSSGTYYIRAKNNTTGCWSTASVAYVTVIANPSVEAGSNLTCFTNQTSVPLTGASPSGGTWSGTRVSGNTFNVRSAGTGNHTVTYSYTNSIGCAGSDTRTVTVVAAPVISYEGSSIITGSESRQLSTEIAYDSYQWYRNGMSIAGATGRSYEVSTAGRYKVKAFKNGSHTFSEEVTIERSSARSANVNHIISHTIRSAGVFDESNIEALGKEQLTEQVQYYDGLGRPTQTVITKGSQGGKDIVQHIAYDEYGREAYKYLPYVHNQSDGTYKPDAPTQQHGFYNGASPLGSHVAQDADPYSRTIFEPSPLNRVLKQGAPGTAWQPKESYTADDKAVVFEYTTNGHNEVYLWEIKDDQCVLGDGQYYEPNQLYVSITKDENWTSGNNGTVREYKDKQGRVVLKRTYDTNKPHDTYYVYDDFGNLRVVLPPEAIHSLGSSLDGLDEDNVFTSNGSVPPGSPGIYYYCPGVTVTMGAGTYGNGYEIRPYPVSADLVEQYLFTYRYDGRQRMIEKQVPGAQPVYMVYDKRDRLVLTQDGNQRQDNQWTFTKYDALNRPVLTGTKTISGSRDAVQAAVNDFYEQSNPMYETRSGNWNTGDHGYTDLSYPKGISEYSYLTATYYDDYGFHGGEPAYVPITGDDIDIGEHLPKPKGQATGAKVKVLGDNEFLKSSTYYDNKYRVILTRAGQYNGDQIDGFTEYDFIGQVMKTKTILSNDEATIATTETFEYDHGGRLMKAWHQVNDMEPVLTTENSYNELGELIDKKLHFDRAEGQFAQSVDYRYNIRGWLTSINNAARTNESGINDDTDDLFGMNLQYNTDHLAIGGTDQFNGNISGMAWSNASYTAKKAYNFAYDKLNRLTDANYKEKTTGSWNVNTGHFSVTGIDYDQNGNIEKLNRKETNTLIDELEYRYDGNRLLSVNDKQNHAGGFVDGEESSTEYLYDANGNMTSDRNKQISDIDYNLLNLPEKVTFEDGRYLEYIYDATGIKLKQNVYEDGTGTTATKATDYVGGMIFENDTLRSIQTAEGRIVTEAVGNDYQYDYQYYLKDHLGNNRVVFKSEQVQYLATMEDAHANHEEATFKNIGNTREANAGYNHTPADGTVSAPNKSALLNSHLLTDGIRRVVGPARGLKVYPGDVVEMEVWARYQEVDNSTLTAATFLFSAMTSAFGITPGDNPVIYDAFNNLLGGTALIGQQPGDVPKAFLNYIFFDKNYENHSVGFEQVGSSADGDHQQLLLSKAITEEGYIYIYVSNESNLNVNVYFDDLKITHTAADMVVQANDYYPFGLTMKPSDFQRDGEQGNKFLYNGKELQTDLNLDWYDYGARMYDAAIGRWNVVDPLAEKYPSISPYAYVANNPILYVDPDGREIWIAFDVTNKDGSTTVQKVQYSGGKLYGTDGKEYTGGNAFATKVQGHLNQLAKDNVDLKGRLSTLEGSRNIHTIQMTDGPDDGNSNSSSKADLRSGTPTGSTTKYNPDKGENVRGDKRAPRAGLAHELLGHGWDADQGKKDYTKTDNGIPMYEVNAVNQENRARAAAGDPKKTTYGGKAIPEKLLDDTHKKEE
jgi:RHS repeat-associated protein